MGIVLCLGEHVGGEMGGVSIGGDNQDLGGAGDEVDADFAGQEFLGGGNINVTGTDDAVGARNRARSEGKGGDSLRAAHLKNLAEAEDPGRSEDLGYRFRAGDANI